jgi:hypothetical protein
MRMPILRQTIAIEEKAEGVEVISVCEQRAIQTNAREQTASCQKSGQVPCHRTNAHSSKP